MTRRVSLRNWARPALLSLLTVLLIVLTNGCGERPAAPASTAARDSHPPLFFDETLFFGAVRAAESAPAPEGAVAGGIIPHHWLGGYLITSFFRGLAAGDAPETVFLIGPNHENAGRARALTSDLLWATPFGLVEPDAERLRALTESGLVQVESAVLTTEHSVAGIMPAIKYYLPEARVVPIILSGELSPAEARRLGDLLAAQSDRDTVVVAAVDFSHYLVSAEARRRDAVSLEVLRTFDAATLFTLNNDYLDSPPSIAVLMAAMAAVRADQFVLLANTNSGALERDEWAPTTSYIVGYYRSGAFSGEATGDGTP